MDNCVHTMSGFIIGKTPMYAVSNPVLNQPLFQQATDPQIFKTGPGTRLLLVSGGPCKRHAKELLGGTTFSQDFSFVPMQTTQELEQFVNMDSMYPGVELNRVPTVWHDGCAKSVGSYDVFLRTAQYRYKVGIYDRSSAELVWKKALNRTKYDTLDQAIVFCSVNTMHSILQTLELITTDARILIASGAIAVVNVPIFGRPSFSIGAGKQGIRSLQWGTVTKDEYQVGEAQRIAKEQKAKAGPRTREISGTGAEGGGGGGGGEQGAEKPSTVPNTRFCKDMYPDGHLGTDVGANGQ